MKALISVFRSAVHRAWRRGLRAQLDHRDRSLLFGLDLEIAPGVLHPAHFASSRYLGRYLTKLNLAERRVADVGTGSGFLGLIAARAGASVSAVDINPDAVLCANQNAERNALAQAFRAVESDCFVGIPLDARFDFVITNPPFYPRAASSLPDRAFAAGAGYEFFATLARQIRGRLTENGRLILVNSSDADFTPAAALFAAHGLVACSSQSRRSLFETLTIGEFKADSTVEDCYRA